MQQDDDVGKVAGASPLVVCQCYLPKQQASSKTLLLTLAKAVELFLQEMLQAIESEARQKGTKKLSMHHVSVDSSYLDSRNCITLSLVCLILQETRYSKYPFSRFLERLGFDNSRSIRCGGSK